MNHNNNPGKFTTPRVIVLAAAVLTTAVLIIGIALIFRPAATRSATPTADRPHGFDREVVKLTGAPRRYTPLFVTTRAARVAISRGDFVSAERIVQHVLHQSRMEDWHFAPFATFIWNIPLPDNARFLQRLNEWVAQDKDSAAPYLLRAQYYYNTGWSIRGNGFVSGVQRDHMDEFVANMEKAAADVSQAMRLDATDPYSAFLWLSILGTDGNTPAMEAAFQQAIRRFPDYYPLYRKRLSTLQPKWGGSPAAMYAFVDAYAEKAGAYSPLKMLYLQLYADLLDTSAVICSSGSGITSQCLDHVMSRLVTEKLDKNAYEVLQMYNHVDKVQFTLEIGRILNEMIDTQGADRYAGAFLQLAANNLHSDIALVAGDVGKNNFMMDKLAGMVWYQKGRFDNAETLFKRAIVDLRNTRFPSEEERDLALARLYDDLADAYNRTYRYRKVVVYQKAADILAGPVRRGRSDLECAALFNLKLYPDAIKACTTQIENGGDMQAFFWRAQAYAASHQTQLALRDYRRVAASESHFRTYAAIAISVVYARRNDMVNMLKALNTYTYLYDPNLEDKQDIAIAYNNRCYAEMHLGALRNALKDCDASLQFGNLPDAYAKQQELLKRLKKRGGATTANHT